MGNIKPKRGEVVQAWMTLARDEKADRSARWNAVEELARLVQMDEAVQALLVLARDEKVDESVRWRAAEALARLVQTDEAVQALLVLTRDKKVDESVRWRAAEAFARFGQTDERGVVYVKVANDVHSGIVPTGDYGVVIGDLRKYSISVAHPKLLSKGYSSFFMVQIYPESLSSQAKKKIMKEFGAQKVAEHEWDIELKKGLKVRIKLYSPVLSFSDPVVKQIRNGLIVADFTVIPNDNCQPGTHYVVLSITEADTQIEYKSISFLVQVVEFAFDHVSRPLLSKVTSAVSGILSSLMFILTAIEQVDKTFGLTAGTAAAVLGSAILVRWWSLFQRSAVTHTS